MEGLNVLSLFDGMSCGHIALDRANVKIKTYYASEVDRNAIEVTMNNNLDTIQLGDVRNVDVKSLEHIDLIIGGSPCQSFSFAGKRKGMSTKDKVEILTLDHYLALKAEGYEFEGQSYLFWEYMRILKAVQAYNPNVLLLLENVIMEERWKVVLTRAIGINPIRINSRLVSAQNRDRYYWTNIYSRPVGLFGDMECMIPQPHDKGILLKDILEDDVDEKYFLSDAAIKRISGYNNGKRCFDIDDKSMCLNAGYNKQGRDNQYIVASRGRNPENPKSREVGLNTEQMLEPRYDGKTNCLTSVQKDNLVMQLNLSTESNGKQPYQQNRVYDINGQSPALVAQMSCGSHAIMIPEATQKGYVEIQPGELFDMENINSSTRRGTKMDDKSNCLMAKTTDFMQYTQDFRIRRLTPTECERLQTVPDGYTQGVSDTQRYRMLGNGWTVDVIAHIFSHIGK